MNSPIICLWENLYNANPCAPAIIDAASGKTYSRSDLNLLVDSIYNAVLELKINRRLVVLHEPNSIRWLALVIALWKADTVIVPVDHSLPDHSVHLLAEGIGASTIFTNGNFVKERAGKKIRNKEVALYKITSGTTGTPKQLPFSENALITDGLNILSTMGFKREDKHLALISFAHSYGFGNLVMPFFLQGAPLVIGSSILPSVISSEIATYQTSVLSTVPTILSALVRSSLKEDSLHPLRLVISAGAPLSNELACAFQKKFGQCPHNFYGSSETGGIAYIQETESNYPTQNSVGKPLHGVIVKLTSRKRIKVISPAVHLRGRRENGGERYVILADKGEMDSDGNIYLSGRLDRIIKVHGRRFDPSEIEILAKELNHVKECFCCVSNEPTQDILFVYEGSADIADVTAKFESTMPAWKRPKRIKQLSQIPQNTHGKINLNAVRGLFRGFSEKQSD